MKHRTWFVLPFTVLIIVAVKFIMFDTMVVAPVAPADPFSDDYEYTDLDAIRSIPPVAPSRIATDTLVKRPSVSFPPLQFDLDDEINKKSELRRKSMPVPDITESL